MNYNLPFLSEILITNEEIKRRIQQLALEISNEYKDLELNAVCILNGSYMFFTYLLEEIAKINPNLKIKTHFMRVSSYDNEFESSGKIKLVFDVQENLKDKNILIIEDIIDTGNTIEFLINHFSKKEVKDIKIATLLLKEEIYKKDIPINFIGFKIPTKFVFGFGLDYKNYYRNIPFIGVVKND